MRKCYLRPPRADQSLWEPNGVHPRAAGTLWSGPYRRRLMCALHHNVTQLDIEKEPDLIVRLQHVTVWGQCVVPSATVQEMDWDSAHGLEMGQHRLLMDRLMNSGHITYQSKLIALKLCLLFHLLSRTPAAIGLCSKYSQIVEDNKGNAPKQNRNKTI